MGFDFEHAVQAPFRMQPGLRRMAPGTSHLTPAVPGSRHQREKLAVLSVFAEQALLAAPDFDEGPALDLLCRQAALEHPQHFAWDGHAARALGVCVADGSVVAERRGVFGHGDEVLRCLQSLPPRWRLAGLLGLAFEQDFAVVDGDRGTIPWLAVALPTHWAPETKVGRHFAEVHAPVADNRLLVSASDALTRLVTGPEAWERFVWTVTPHPRLHGHPARIDPDGWAAVRDAGEPIERHAWWRTERQTFIARPGLRQAVFTIGVQLRPLVQAIDSPARAQALHDALASMSDAVLAYRHLADVREPLMAWLRARAAP